MSFKFPVKNLSFILNCTLTILLNLLLILPAAANNSAIYLKRLESNSTPSSFVVHDEQGRTLYSHGAQTRLVPASTIKVLTAFMAVEHWGLDHKFHTDLLLDKNSVLWVKGYGDPYLVSEEIQVIAERVANKLRSRNIQHLNGVMIDDSYFDNVNSQLQTPRSLNPYDAPLAAVSANFNSVGFIKKNHEISPIEWQTPLTSLTIELSELTSNGKKRISLRNGAQAGRYFKELLTEKLREQGISVTAHRLYPQPRALPIFYRHYNSHPLSEVVESMLKYSNNFIANQLFLMLGVENSRRHLPASMPMSQTYARAFINKRFNWANYHVSDGAGLSRETRVSAQQMVQLLAAFKPYHFLLPCINHGQICAKTGTLSDVHSYAGYFVSGQQLYPFAMFFAQRMPYQFRKKMAKAFYNDMFEYNSY